MQAKKFIATMAIVLFWASNVSAQGQVDVVLQEEIIQETAPRKKVVAPSAAPGGVVIMNNQNSEQSTAQAARQGVNAEQASSLAARQQPITVVEATPLVDSRSEAIRRARQSAEIQTEQIIVEKLETSRIEDEKRRQQRVLANNFGGDEVVVVAPAAARTEEIIIIEKTSAKHEAVKPKPTSNFVLGLGAGITAYPTVNNVQGNQAYGFTLGQESSDGLTMEAQFGYANFYVNEYFRFPLFREMEQYTFGGALKYTFMRETRIRPYFGGLANYSYRRYYNRLMYTGQRVNTGFTDNEMTSQALDLGLTTGLDFMVNESLSVGVDFRYSMNVYNRINNNYFNSGYIAGGSPVEELSYYTMLLNAKMRF